MKRKIIVITLLLIFGFFAIAPETFACHRHRYHRVAYRSYHRPYYRVASTRYYNPNYHRSSKLKTFLTIAAPAAFGAGIGALVGGKKGAGIGALFGGGGGAAYYLIKHRNRY